MELRVASIFKVSNTMLSHTLAFQGVPIGFKVVPFWDYLYRILNIKPKKELQWSLQVRPSVFGVAGCEGVESKGFLFGLYT